MRCTLALCIATVVTGKTGGQWLDMIGRRCPCTCAMTRVTVRICRYMVRRLTLGNRAIVTGITAPHDFIVINLGGRRPAGIAVAAFTAVSRANVLGAFTPCSGAIMTGATAPHYLIVINLCGRRPAVLAMTTFTVIRCSDVLTALASGNTAIMTGGTGRQWLDMIRCRCPATRAMTTITIQ